MTAARPRGTGHPGFSETHPRTEATVPVARLLVRHALSLWKLEGDAADPAALALSELVTNAVRHARGPTLRVVVNRPDDRCVCVAVVDRAPHGLPVLRMPGDAESSGRGLLLVDAVATCWGYDLLGPRPRPWGKRVWCPLETKR